LASRRAFLAGGLAALGLSAAPAARALGAATGVGATRVDWAGFRSRFVTPEGRIVDTGNGGISHSEGQGVGLLLAAAGQDREAFARIWRWTQANLGRPADSLFSWRYEPQRGVTDRNNASDGDLLIAWGLLRGAKAWRESAYAEAAAATALAVRRQLFIEHVGRLVLLPALEGFRGKDGSVEVNPSYLVLPAFAAFAEAGFEGGWRDVGERSVRFLRDVRFGPHDLPIDWVRIDPHGALWAEASKPARFGFDAVRIPLYLKWGGASAEPAVRAAGDWWRSPGQPPAGPPAWVDVTTGVTAEYPASAGMIAVRNYVTGAPPPPPPVAADYYAWALWNLTALAAAES
jgi:endoglucanase